MEHHRYGVYLVLTSLCDRPKFDIGLMLDKCIAWRGHEKRKGLWQRKIQRIGSPKMNLTKGLKKLKTIPVNNQNTLNNQYLIFCFPHWLVSIPQYSCNMFDE